MNPAVLFEGVTFYYPETEVQALDRVSLQLDEGMLVLVAGPTGSGKSTFLRAINGLVPHFTGGEFSGRVLVAGRSTLDAAPRDLADVVAFVPQDPNASFVVDRVEDELAYAMENLAVDPRVMRRRVEEMLDVLGIESLRKRSVRTLSGGERQRVAIASALTPGPRVLVLDEPTSQLDPQGAEDVLAALQRLVHDIGMTVVLAEHRLERVAGFADVAVGLLEGKARIGAPDEILADSESIPPVTRLGRAAGWKPLPLTVRAARRWAGEMELAAPPMRPVVVRERLLHVDGLYAGYGSTPVLKKVSLDIGGGEIVALMGRNGSGKTTLLRCIAGVHPADEGAVEVNGAPPEPGHSVALCPQAPDTVLFKDTVVDEVRATITWSGSSVSGPDLMRSLGLSGLGARHPRDLSAGQRLLVAIAAITASGAPLLLLDEPTRGLDHPSKAQLASFLKERARTDGAVFFATHDVELVAEVATRVILLAGGEVISDGTPTEVIGDSAIFAPQMARVFGPEWLTPAEVSAALALSAGSE